MRAGAAIIQNRYGSKRSGKVRRLSEGICVQQDYGRGVGKGTTVCSLHRTKRGALTIIQICVPIDYPYERS